MKLPSTIRIGHMDYALEVVPPNGIDNGKSKGEYHFDGGQIRIAENEPGAMVQRLLHELNHGILFHSGLDQIPAIEEHEEALCNANSCGWLQIFRDNPWLLAYIAKAVKG